MIFSSKAQFLILTCSTLITSSTGNIFGMNQLCFYLNGNRQIEAYSAHGDMEFYVEPEEFEGKDILDVLPFSNITREAILKKFNTATEENKIVDTAYDLENTNYTAEITPLSNQVDNSYFVKIWETLTANSPVTLCDMGPLCFYLNGIRHIEAASAHNGMKFYVEQKEFEGKDILDVLPFSQIIREAILKKFNRATEKNKIVNVVYDLENSDYTAEITPLNNQKDTSFFVNVWGS